MINATGRACRALIWRLRCWSALKFARGQSYRRLRCGAVRRILVVCYGNIYRSAYAGAALAKLLGPTADVRSGGFHPIAGREPPRRIQQMARLHGVELSSHTSRLIVAEDLAWADTIVLMDRHNWQQLIQQGAAPSRIVWLGALDGGVPEIADPYDLDDAAAQAIVDRLQRCTARLAGLIGESLARGSR